jgi:hypothetical protein
VSKPERKMLAVEAYYSLGHLLSQMIEEVAKHIDWKLTLKLGRYEDCAIGKRRQKVLLKKANTFLLRKLVNYHF